MPTRTTPIKADGMYRVACDQCGTVCRTMPECFDGSGLPGLWFCRCNHPADPRRALLLCDTCHQTHRCPEAKE